MLKTLGYRMDLDGQMGLAGPQHVERAIGPVFEARKTAIRHLIKNEYWDLCIAVITETDRLQHFFLHALSDPGHPQYQWTRRFYVELDAFIAEIAELVDGKADLFMVSDHGFDVVRRLVLVEDFLRDLGLAPASDVPCWADPAIAAKTPVFCLDPGRFYINRKGGRFPGAFVGEQEGKEILERLTQALRGLKDPDTGAPMVSSVRTKQEGFWGDTTGYAPDLVAATHPGYYFRAFWFPEKTKVVNIKWEANHVWNDAIVFTPYPIAAGRQPMIWDVLPSALARMGIALPVGIDGRDLNHVPIVTADAAAVPV